MRREQEPIETWLVLSLRHLGDAVVVSGFVNALANRNPGVAIDVLGRPDLREITRELCTVRNYFPIDIAFFGHHRKDIQAMLGAVRTIAQLRRRRYDGCINLMGDFRENAIARVLRADSVLAPEWPEKHPFRRHIRAIPSPTGIADSDRLHHIDAGYYASISSFARQMGLGELRWPRLRRREEIRSVPVVGIHPGASHVSKQWPIEKWKVLISRLATRGVAIQLYGAPSEEASLRRQFRNEIDEFGIDVITGSVSDFLRSLTILNVLVCVDSFSCHAAHAVGIPTVVLFGPFDPTVMTPPTGIPLSAGRECAIFPCYKGRSCKNAENPYICVQGISVDAVMGAVEAKIASSKKAAAEEPIERQVCTAHE